MNKDTQLKHEQIVSWRKELKEIFKKSGKNLKKKLVSFIGLRSIKSFNAITSDFFQEVLKYPNLNKKVEYSLRKAAENGNEFAKEKFISCNMYLIFFSLLKLSPSITASIDLNDLVQEALKGLYDAYNNFNPELGYRFSTFAPKFIVYHIVRDIDYQRYTVPLPDYLRRYINKLSTVKLEFLQKTGRDGKTDEILELFNKIYPDTPLDMEKYLELDHVIYKYKTYGDDEFAEEYDFDICNIPDHDQVNQKEYVEYRELMDCILDCIEKTMDETERYIVCNFFFFLCEEPKSILKISEDLDLGYTKVSNTFARALDKFYYIIVLVKISFKKLLTQ